MAKLPDLIATGLRQEDLIAPGDPPLPGHVDTINRTFNLAIRSLSNAVTRGLNFTDNIQSNFIIAKFTHGVATSLSIGSLPQANGCLILGVDKGHAVVYHVLQGSSTAGQVKLTCYFADTTATNIKCAVVLLPEGLVSTAAPQTGVWTALPFASGFSNFPGNMACGYLKDSNGFVHLRGFWQAAAAAVPISTVIATLPVGYRPSATTSYAVANFNNAWGPDGAIQILSNGNIQTIVFADTAAGTAGMSLDGISFDTRS